MTRARRSLALVTSGAYAFDSESELMRKVEAPLPVDLPEPDQYQLPDVSVVDLSYAGRLAETSQTLSAVADAEVDDPLTLERREGKWMILDARGRVLGRMAGNWNPPDGTNLVTGKVGAIVRWRKSDNEEAFQTYIKRGEWETVLPELVFRRMTGV